MNDTQAARELVAAARELTAAKQVNFSKVDLGSSFKHKGKTYWKASRTRACLQKNMVNIRLDEKVSV